MAEHRFVVLVTEQQIDMNELALRGEVQLKTPPLAALRLMSVNVQGALVVAVWDGYEEERPND